MIDLDKLFRKLRYEKPKNRYEGKYSYSEMITFADSAIKEQQLINKNDCIADVSDCTPPDKFGKPTIKLVLANPCDFCKYDKYEGENKNKDACSHCAKSLKDNEYYR